MHHACYYHFCGLTYEGCASIPKGGVTLAKGSVVQIKWSVGFALSRLWATPTRHGAYCRDTVDKLGKNNTAKAYCGVG